jgi:D-psicose/D-tagatose/L-ribulose 3-epimerase
LHNAYDYQKAAEIVRNHGLDVTVAAAMAPGRDLIHPDENIREIGLAYIRHCIEATNTLVPQI